MLGLLAEAYVWLRFPGDPGLVGRRAQPHGQPIWLHLPLLRSALPSQQALHWETGQWHPRLPSFALYHTPLPVSFPSSLPPFLSLDHLNLHNSTEASVCQLQNHLCTLGVPALFRRQGLGSAPVISICWSVLISWSHKSDKVVQNCVNFVPRSKDH